VQRVMDLCSGEIGRRYTTGAADPSELVPEDRH
jgi:hypothetical protein